MRNKILTFLLLLMTSSFAPVCAQIPNTLTIDEKIYGLSKFWSEVNYNFVYLYKIDRNEWDSAYKKAITNIRNTTNDYEYFRQLQKLCALLKDGHTQVYIPDEIQNRLLTTDFGEYRLFLTNVQGKVYVYNVNMSKAKEIPMGSELLKINGLTTSAYMEKYLKPYISSSTESSLIDKATFNLLTGFEGEKYNIEIKTPKGEIKRFTITHAKSYEKELAAEALPDRKIFEFKWLENNIAYLAIRSFNDASVVSEFESKLSELKKAKSIILDIRNNGGGSGRNALNIAKYFIANDTIYPAKNYSRKIIPSDRAIGSFLSRQDTVNGKAQWGISKEDATAYYKSYMGTQFHNYEYKPIISQSELKLSVPTVIMTNNYTASAAEDFLIYLYNESNIIRIGDYSNGSTGQPLEIELPGNASAWICTKKVTLANGEEFVGIGIKPHIQISRNLNDVLYPLKYDSQLQESLRYLKANRNK